MSFTKSPIRINDLISIFDNRIVYTPPKIPIPRKNRRVIAIVDFYTFATQVLARKNNDKDWNNGPTITHLHTGRIISANKPAKDIGINNKIFLKEAEQIMKNYPELKLKKFEMPLYENGKPDQTLLREAAEQLRALVTEAFWMEDGEPPAVQWVPMDEVYFDLTSQFMMDAGEVYIFSNLLNPEVSNLSNIVLSPRWKVTFAQSPTEFPLAEVLESDNQGLTPTKDECFTMDDIDFHIGAVLINSMCSAIHQVTGLHTSAGIGENKMMAKIAATIAHPGTVQCIRRKDLKNEFISSIIPIKKLSIIPPHIRQNFTDHGIDTHKKLKDLKLKFDSISFENIETTDLTKFVTSALCGIDNTLVEEKLCTKNIRVERNFKFKPVYTYERGLLELRVLLEEFKQRIQEELNWKRYKKLKPRRPRDIKLIIKFKSTLRKTFPIKYDQLSVPDLYGGWANCIDWLKGVVEIRFFGGDLEDVELTEEELGVNIRYCSIPFKKENWSEELKERFNTMPGRKC